MSVAWLNFGYELADQIRLTWSFNLHHSHNSGATRDRGKDGAGPLNCHERVSGVSLAIGPHFRNRIRACYVLIAADTRPAWIARTIPPIGQLIGVIFVANLSHGGMLA